MLLQLATRNIARNMRRLVPMVVILAVSFLSLLVGNAVLSRSVEALRGTYVEHVAGELSVAAESEASFTIFGSEQLLVGEYLVPPTIVDYERLQEHVSELPEVRASTGLISAAARVRVGGRRREQTVFGVDFEDYQEMFPELELVAGEFPEPGSRGIVVQEGNNWPDDVVGRDAVLAVARETSFTLREVPVTGVFRYPVEDELLNRVALTDPATARALNGYIAGTVGRTEIPEEQQELMDSDMDSMFSSGGDDGPAGGGENASGSDGSEGASPSAAGGAGDAGGIPDPEALLDSVEEKRKAQAARKTVEGAWNFLLISTAEGASAADVRGNLEDAGFDEDSGYLIRGWRDTVGGTAQIVSYLQLFFNIGLLFVAFGAAAVTTNALVLSVLERTKEIGTLRALGATKFRVALLIGLETLIVVVGAAAAGLILGAGATAVLNESGLVLENQYIRILFGGGPIRGSIDSSLVGFHLLAALALALVAVVYPLKRALGIAPVEAMAE